MGSQEFDRAVLDGEASDSCEHLNAHFRLGFKWWLQRLLMAAVRYFDIKVGGLAFGLQAHASSLVIAAQNAPVSCTLHAKSSASTTAEATR
jgi:hypothetical protein